MIKGLKIAASVVVIIGGVVCMQIVAGVLGTAVGNTLHNWINS